MLGCVKLIIKRKASAFLLILITVSLTLLLQRYTNPPNFPNVVRELSVTATESETFVTTISNQLSIERQHVVHGENIATENKPTRSLSISENPTTLIAHQDHSTLYSKGKVVYNIKPLEKVKEASYVERQPLSPINDPNWTTSQSPTLEEAEHKNTVIATVVCAKFGDGTPLTKATMMVKSALIAAQIYNISKIDIYLLLEYREDELMFTNKFQEFGFKNHEKGVHIHFQYVQDHIPAIYQKHMLYHKRSRCNYAKIFLPSALKDVDSVLYVDMDVIVVGNPAEIWNHFYKMNSVQLVGMTRNSEPEHPLGRVEFLQRFGEIPHLNSTGLNDGVLLMNLTRMREYKWEKKLLQVYKDYSKVVKKAKVNMDCQKILNVLLYYAENLFYLLPCHFNLRSIHCSKGGLYCKDTTNDKLGIQLVHGSDSQFEVGGAFHYLYKVYDKITLKYHGINFTTELMIPLRKAYSPPKLQFPANKEYKQRYKCYRSLSKLLFPSFFSKSKN